MKILLATNNRHKAKEIGQIFDAHKKDAIEILLPKDVLTEPLDPVEDSPTLAGNAAKKAREFFEAAKIPTVADDTGLEIDALGGEPGVMSARYAGEHGDNQANRDKVLRELKDVPTEKRAARFKTVFCYFDGERERLVEGVCVGKIIDEERGDGGFGYDPIFVPDGYEQTFSEMSDSEKNAISHRGRATEKLFRLLESMM